MDEWIDDALEIDEFYELMCDRSGDNQRMFEEIEEQKGTHEILRDCVAVIIYNNNFLNSVSSIKS